MREVSETLEAAQSSSSRTPYIHLVFTSYDEETAYDLSTDGDYGNRILLLDYPEESYNEYAVIALRNYDRGLPTDLRGYWVEIGLGDVTGGGNEYATYPRLWVKHQQSVSAAGRLIMILELEGMWAKLRETKMMLGNPPYYDAEYTTDTPYDIINLALAEIDPAMVLEALVQDDGIIDTITPAFSINTSQLFEDAGSIIYRLLQMTKSFLREKSELEFEVRYPQSDDDVDITYYSKGFYEFSYRKNLQVPNHIYCVANAGEDGLWTDAVVGEASDTDSIAAHGDVPDIVLAPDIITVEDAGTRAEVVLARNAAEEQAGTLVIPHDCRVELYDLIEVIDLRGG